MVAQHNGILRNGKEKWGTPLRTNRKQFRIVLSLKRMHKKSVQKTIHNIPLCVSNKYTSICSNKKCIYICKKKKGGRDKRDMITRDDINGKKQDENGKEREVRFA